MRACGLVLCVPKREEERRAPHPDDKSPTQRITLLRRSSHIGGPVGTRSARARLRQAREAAWPVVQAIRGIVFVHVNVTISRAGAGALVPGSRRRADDLVRSGLFPRFDEGCRREVHMDPARPTVSVSRSSAVRGHRTLPARCRLGGPGTRDDGRLRSQGVRICTAEEQFATRHGLLQALPRGLS